MFLGLGVLTVILGLGALANSASAYKGNPSVKGPNYSAERHTLMEKAFETNDYNAWKSLMQGKGRVTQVINKDNFAKFAEAHRLAEKGDLAGAQKIRQELGLNNGANQNQKANNGFGRGMNRGNGLNR